MTDFVTAQFSEGKEQDFVLGKVDAPLWNVRVSISTVAKLYILTSHRWLANHDYGSVELGMMLPLLFSRNSRIEEHEERKMR